MNKFCGIGYACSLFINSEIQVSRLLVKNVINPLAAICALGMLLEEIGEGKAAQAVEEAVIKLVNSKIKSLAVGKMGYSTQEVGDLVVKLIS